MGLVPWWWGEGLTPSYLIDSAIGETMSSTKEFQEINLKRVENSQTKSNQHQTRKEFQPLSQQNYWVLLLITIFIFVFKLCSGSRQIILINHSPMK